MKNDDLMKDYWELEDLVEKALHRDGWHESMSDELYHPEFDISVFYSKADKGQYGSGLPASIYVRFAFFNYTVRFDATIHIIALFHCRLQRVRLHHNNQYEKYLEIMNNLREKLNQPAPESTP